MGGSPRAKDTSEGTGRVYLAIVDSGFAIVDSACIVLSDIVDEEGVLSVDVAGVSSAFLPHPITTKARPRARMATIAKANNLRMWVTFTSSRSNRFEIASDPKPAESSLWTP